MVRQQNVEKKKNVRIYEKLTFTPHLIKKF